MYRKPGTIVVGVDGSDSSTRAVQWAARQATAERRELTLVHALHPATSAFSGTVDARAEPADEGKKVLHAARATAEWTAPDLEVHEILELDDPRDLLLRLSESASMVVVGSRGRGHVASLVLGSVSVALVRQAHSPVVVLRPTHTGTVRNGILVGVDASPESLPVLEFAYRQASLRDLPLTILDCVVEVPAGTVGAFVVSESAAVDLDDERLALAEAMAGMGEKYPEVRVTTQLPRGLPRAALVSRSDRMDLIVVGAHQDGRISQAIFGSVSVDVVEAATCPVAVIPVSRSL